jgi:hypothetical protein
VKLILEQKSCSTAIMSPHQQHLCKFIHFSSYTTHILILYIPRPIKKSTHNLAHLRPYQPYHQSIPTQPNPQHHKNPFSMLCKYSPRFVSSLIECLFYDG